MSDVIEAGGSGRRRSRFATAQLILGIFLVAFGSWATYVAISEHRNTPYTFGPMAVGFGIIQVMRYRKGRRSGRPQ